jgi:nucleotide-binding universal stress UspA family protein
MKISDVLVPTDFSPGSMRALEFALSLVEPGGEIYLLHAIDADFVARLSEEGFGEPEEVTERLRLKAEERMVEVRQAVRDLRQSLETMVVVGKPFAEILRVASDLDFSMIVLGVRGRRQGDIEEMLFGSTAEKVLRGARVPVVCVPPGWSK